MKLKLWLAYLAPAIESHQTAFLFLLCLFFCFLVHLNLAYVVGIALGWLCFRDQCWVNAKPGCWPNLNRLLPSFRLVFFFFNFPGNLHMDMFCLSVFLFYYCPVSRKYLYTNSISFFFFFLEVFLPSFLDHSLL